jgi:hypothetical protein
MAQAQVTGRKPRARGNRIIRRPSGPPLPNEITPKPPAELKAVKPANTPPIRGPPIPLAYDVSEFCAAFKISKRMYFKLRDEGLGPREMRLGRRVLITIESAQAWARAREREAESAAC